MKSAAPPLSSPAAAFPSPVLALAVRTALQRLPAQPLRVAVAVSGGADSAMLAAHGVVVAREQGIAPLLFHVHHGLQAAADDWAASVQRLGALLQAPVMAARVQVVPGQGSGIEAAARDARYAALAGLACQHGVTHILLAHHRGDQAETVLLRLLRGAGLKGMAAMPPQARRGEVLYLRPWLDIEREVILCAAQAFAARHDWYPVQDPTNADVRYTRAAVRELLVPALDRRWPGWRAVIARHARHMAEAVEILDDVACGDLASLQPSADGRSFSLAAWRGLSVARQKQVLRYWLQANGAPMPTDARLADLARQLRQLHSLGHDRGMQLAHAGSLIRCRRGRVQIEAAPPGEAP